MSKDMRAKFMCTGVEIIKDEKENVVGEKVIFSPVCGDGAFPEDGTSDDNTYARWTPAGHCWLMINNPALFGVYHYGQKFYVDFTPENILHYEK